MSVRSAVKRALAWLGLDAAPVQLIPQSAFFFKNTSHSVFDPQLHILRNWADLRCFYHLPRDYRVLSNLQDACDHGLDSMPNVDPVVAALLVLPDEALKLDAHCPQPQHNLTEDFLVKSYDMAARIGNS